MKSSSAKVAMTFLLLGAVATSSAAQSGEYVTVQKVMDDQVLIARGNGDTYLIEKGIGCLSLWRFEGKRVIVSSPGLFLGIGSKLVIPDNSQECRIWNSKQIDSPGSIARQTAPEASREMSRATDEVSLFDSRGRATAYLDTGDGLTFFLWTGEPTAYLNDDSVYGFNGKHLGWYKDGMVFDHDGDVVVAPASSFRDAVKSAPSRGLKSLKPLKGLRELKPLKPLFGRAWSDLPARVFFMLGVD